MVTFSCFSKLFIQRKKRPQKSSRPIDARRLSRIGDLRIKPEELIHPSHDNCTKEASVAAKSPLSYLHVVGNKTKDEILTATAATAEVAYEGGDEHDDVRSMKRDFSDFDLQAIGANNGIIFPGFTQEFNHHLTENKPERVEEATPELLVQSGHVSDPGMKRTVDSWGSPSLKRSCSNIERRRSSKFLASPIMSYSYEDLQKLCVNGSGNVHDHLGSPASIMTSCSADKVMLKKRSSSQVLPSRSRKLWWKLFLRSHRNLHKSGTSKREKTISGNDTCNQRGGYCSDTLEPSHKVDMKMKRPMEDQGVKAGFWPQNQWVAFCAESSSLDRVSAWVHSLDDSPLYPVDDDEVAAGGAYDDMTYTEEGEPSCRNLPHVSRHTLEEVVQANHIVESLNSSSSVAHISGMGLKVIPTISALNSLRAINLSGNFIVHISPVSLPKGLHTLDLSRNKIATIEGLRELTKLRVLNLSYNRISRIGHGLSHCVLIKELYLAGNKISDVEGLHRLLKLIVLDLSFNKIATRKALGQLVDNYNSLLALNLLGNPVQMNIGDDQLRKTVCSLLPQLVYLNKQPTKPSRAREVAVHRIAKVALGDIDWNSRKRSMRRTVSNSSTSRGKLAEGSNHKGVGNGSGQKNRQRSKGRLQHPSSLRK